jgi:hypothetical protein
MTAEQIMLVGFLATLITLTLRLLAQWGGINVGRAVINIVLYVIALLLGWVWTGVLLPTFPPFADSVSFVAALLQFASELLVSVAPVVGIATLIYNLLYDKVVVPVTARFSK